MKRVKRYSRCWRRRLTIHGILTSPPISIWGRKATDAINRLKGAKDIRNNPVLQLNPANAYLQGGQPGEAVTILNRYTFNNKDDQNGWELLARARGNWVTAIRSWPRVRKARRWRVASIRPFPC